MAINKKVSQKYLYGERNILQLTIISYQLTVINEKLLIEN